MRIVLAIALASFSGLTLGQSTSSVDIPTQGSTNIASETRESAISVAPPKTPNAVTQGNEGARVNEELTKLESDAAQGDTSAQFVVGVTYVYGLGTARDYVKAKSWLTKAAEGGYGPAQTHLGLIHLRGRGVEKDEKAAMEWFQKGAKWGDSYAGSNYRELRRKEDWVAGEKKGIFLQGSETFDGECSKRAHESRRIAVGKAGADLGPQISVTEQINNCMDVKNARRFLKILSEPTPSLLSK